ncbi:MAG: T9SS type A sorting domain-containing protein [Bacteroidetes bacterium]|nr:T9SS type A sorting domain-containing protein [Bacteroidota bacterium]
MKKSFLCLALILSLLSMLNAQCLISVPDTLYIHCGESKQLQASTNPGSVASHTTNSLNQINFYDPDHGFIVGDSGTILRSTDNGQNWALTTFLNDENWESVNFSSPGIGYIVSGSGKIAKTIDGGVNWSIIYDNPAEHFNRVKFINPFTGFVIGRYGRILKTTDGGINWNPVESGTFSSLNDIVFVNGVKGFIAGDHDIMQNMGILLITLDGGDTWTNSPAAQSSYPFNLRLAFANENTGYLQTDSYLFKTLDGGATWNQTSIFGSNGFALWNDSTGFLCDYSGLAKFTHYGDDLEFIGDNWMDKYTDVACPDNKTVLYISDEGKIYAYRPVFESYHWEPSTGLNADNIANPVASPDKTTTYEVTAQLANGSTCSDSVTVMITPNFYWPELCIVTVDSATSHNRIIWNKPLLNTADSVYLLKEGNVSGQFTRLGSFPASLPGEYIDDQSDPIIKSESYAISVLDKCSQEYQGDSHSTMHLSINQGVGTTWNLIWQEYSGTLVYTYNIYRGINAGSLQLIASVSGSVNQYSDLNAPPGDVYYLIEAILDADCSGSKSQASSFSNIARNQASPHGIADDNLAVFSIGNNPVNEVFTLQTDKSCEIRKVSLMSVNCKIISEWGNPGELTFDISSVPSGIYLLKIDTKGNQSFMRKLVKL